MTEQPKMEKDIPQQFSCYNFLSPLYSHQYDFAKYQTGYHGIEDPDKENLVPSYTQTQYPYYKQAGYHTTGSPDKDGSLVPASPPSLSPSSSGYGSILETPKQKTTDVNASTSPEIGDHRFGSYEFIAYRLSQTDRLSQTEDTKSQSEGEEERNSKERQSPSSKNISSLSKESTLSPKESTLSPKEPNLSPKLSSVSPKVSSSASSPSDSTKSSSSPSSNTSPGSDSKPAKKNARTAYTNEQIEKLLKIFHENPYPESEYMERIAMDFGVTENKIKIWFQNKRARWRRRVNNNNNNNNNVAYHQQYMSAMLPPVSQYGYVPYGQFMTQSQPMMPGYPNYVAMQAPNSAESSMNNGTSRFQTTYPSMMSSSQPTYQMMSSVPYSGTSPPLTSNGIYLPHGQH